MIIGGVEHKNITITGQDDEVLAVVMDDQVIEKDGIKVHFDVGESDEE